MNKDVSTSYEGFNYDSKQLSAFIFSIDTFVLSTINGDVIRHEPENPDKFLAWLKLHNIRDVREEIGSMVYNFYFDRNT